MKNRSFDGGAGAFGTILFRYLDGIFPQTAYLRLKELSTAHPNTPRLLIVPVKPENAETAAEMVTDAAFYLDAAALAHVQSDPAALGFLKKLCIAVRYALLAGGADAGRMLRFSIITPPAHIHFPAEARLSDKKLERCVRSSLEAAYRLLTQTTPDDIGSAGERAAAEDGDGCGYLIYYDADSKIITESKADYVRRIYSNAVAAGTIDPEKQRN